MKQSNFESDALHPEARHSITILQPLDISEPFVFRMQLGQKHIEDPSNSSRELQSRMQFYFDAQVHNRGSNCIDVVLDPPTAIRLIEIVNALCDRILGPDDDDDDEGHGTDSDDSDQRKLDS